MSGLIKNDGPSGVRDVMHFSDVYAAGPVEVKAGDFQYSSQVATKQGNPPKSSSWLAGLAPSKWIDSLASMISSESASAIGASVMTVGGGVISTVTLPLWFAGTLAGMGVGGLIGGLVGLVAKGIEQVADSRESSSVSIKDYVSKGAGEGAHLGRTFGSFGGMILMPLGMVMAVKVYGDDEKAVEEVLKQFRE